MHNSSTSARCWPCVPVSSGTMRLGTLMLLHCEPPKSKQRQILYATSAYFSYGMYTTNPPCSTPQHFQAIVVGLGAMGSAALYHLAKLGVKVLGIERQPSTPHTMGSSHGESRIIRLAYHEHPEYIPLLKEAYRLWEELEQESNQRLFLRTGYMDISPRSSHDSDAYSLCDRSVASAQRYGLRYEVLNAKEVNQRFPAFCLPEKYQACFQADGGILVPEKCIDAHVQLAQRMGAEVHTQETVTGWKAPRDAAGHVTVHTDKGTYTCNKLVLASGPWISQHVPELKALCVPERQVVGWFQIQQQHRQHFSPSALPVFCVGDDKNAFYAFPEFGSSPGLKVGKFRHLRQDYDNPDTLDRQINKEDEEILREGLKQFTPAAAGPLLQATTCIFTNTPDGDFIIDVHPRHPQVVLCSACSGHGFKMSNVVGKLLAQLAVHGRTDFNIEFLRLSADRPSFQRPVEALHTPAPAASSL